MNDLRGIILYTQTISGDLNGIYTNNHIAGARLYTETARLIHSQGSIGTNGRMAYECFYFDERSERYNATLLLEIINGLITATWTLENESDPIFIGEGYQMGDRLIAISYAGNNNQ